MTDKQNLVEQIATALVLAIMLVIGTYALITPEQLTLYPPQVQQ